MESKPFLNSMPFDMDKLNNLTDGKPSVRDEITAFFFFNISECVHTLEKNCHDGHSQKWENASDELQALSNQFGAVELSDICAVTSLASSLGSEDKKKSVQKIKNATQKLKAFLKNI